MMREAKFDFATLVDTLAPVAVFHCGTKSLSKLSRRRYELRVGLESRRDCAA
jgi:hypothetical protein